MESSIRKILITFILLIYFAPVASAEELITGAFGIKLGERLSLNIVLSMNRDRNEARIQPKIPNELFDYYFVEFTPKTETIAVIGARAEVKFCPSDEERGLVSFLTKKYGEPSSPTRYDRVLNSTPWIDAKGREIKLSCYKRRGIPTLSLVYFATDDDIWGLLYKEQKELDKERKELDIESVDPSGL